MIKRIILLIFLLFISAGCSSTPGTYQYVKINDKIIKVETAKTEKEQERGLSDHRPIFDDEGMLFIFKEKKIRNFWMKEMNFPLDIIWINDDRIIKIDKNLQPEGKEPANIYSSDQAVNYVLEINAGLVEKYDIKIGDKVKYEL